MMRKLLNLSFIPKRAMSVRSTYLKYTEYGEPISVLKKYEETLDEPKDTEVLVKILAAPVNPADINVMQGEPSVLLEIFRLNCGYHFEHIHLQENIPINLHCQL